MSDLLSVKQALHKHCLELLEERVSDLQRALASIQEARNQETKSSVGDKYETGRAMMQQEEEKYRTRLTHTHHLLGVLHRLNPARVHERVLPGSLILTDTGTYYLAVGFGKVQLAGNRYYVISPESPIGRLLLNKGVGDTVHFNGKPISIRSIS